MPEELIPFSSEYDSDHLFVNASDGVLRILLLEDLQSDAELIKLQLRKLGMEKNLHHVTNGKDFEAAYDSFIPHLVLTDYALPQYTGMEALKFVRTRNPFVPVIICTGSVNEETAVACIKAGADDYVLKDAMTRLPSAIENALRSRSDAVEKVRAMANLSASEENFRALAENAPESIYKIDRSGTILYVNRPVDGFKREELNGKFIFDLVRPQNHSALRAGIEHAYDQNTKVTLELEGDPEDPESRWYLCRIGPVVIDHSVNNLVFIPSDITERVLAAREQALLADKLTELTRHLEHIRDEEKEKIAMEIHDQLGQELTGTKLGLFALKQMLQADPINKEPMNEKISYLVDLTTTTIETVRRIAHELRPVVLDNMGLLAAMEWHVENFNKNHEVHCSLHLDVEDLHFGKDFSTAIYRIMQEALTNINRHAEASKAWIDFLVEDGQLMLQIRDNGKGLKPEEALRSRSMGLFGMRERVRGWDGKFFLSSPPGQGSIIRITFDAEKLIQQQQTNPNSPL